MVLRNYLEKNWEAVKMYFSINDNYIPGAIFYRMTEMDFDDFIVKTYISKKIMGHKDYNSFKHKENRYNLNKKVKKYFGKDSFIEHIVPKKFILEYWKKCNDIVLFEKFIRDEASICILTKKEDGLLPKYNGRESFEKAMNVYKKCGLEIAAFNFIYEKGVE
jgi:hypothetical protein